MKKTLVLIFALFVGLVLHAQAPEDLILTKTVFIKDAHVVQEPGKSPTVKSILIRNGLISDIGKKLTPPSDAIVIDADSMWVYPAFIDACSFTAQKSMEDEDKKDQDALSLYQKASVQPQFAAASNVDRSSKDIMKMRNAGFGLSHVVPKGKILSGQGTILLLDEKVTELTLSQSKSSYGSLNTSRGQYPSTVIGVMALYKDMFTQARIAHQHQLQYESDPLGRSIPAYAPEIVALYPIIEKKQKLFFEAENRLELARTIQLMKSIQVPMILTEVKQVEENFDKIQENDIDFLLSLDLPSYDKSLDSISETDPDKRIFLEKKKAAYKKAVSQAAFCEKNNQSFAFSFLGVKPEKIHKNIQTLIENGLSPDMAMAALTTNAADILGLDEILGTIEEGKIANLILCDTLLFTKDYHINATIVNGVVYKHEQKSKDNKSCKGTSELDGNWSFSVDIPDASTTGMFEFDISPNENRGYVTVNPDDERYDLDNIKIEDDEVSFTSLTDVDGFDTSIQIKLQLDGDQMEGTVTIPGLGSFPLTGSKQPKN